MLREAAYQLTCRLMNDRRTRSLRLSDDSGDLFHARCTLSLRARHLSYLCSLDKPALHEVSARFSKQVGNTLSSEGRATAPAVRGLLSLVVTHQQPSLSEAALDALEVLLCNVPKALAVALYEGASDDDDVLVDVEPCFWVTNGTSRVALPWNAQHHICLQGITEQTCNQELHMV